MGVQTKAAINPAFPEASVGLTAHAVVELKMAKNPSKEVDDNGSLLVTFYNVLYISIAFCNFTGLASGCVLC